jgi:phosphoserine phosphatase
MSETVLLHFSGADHPGLTTALTSLLAEYDACILDVGQAVVHETLALGLLIELPSGSIFEPLKIALLAKAQSLGLHVRFTPISHESLEHWLAGQSKDRFLITLLGRAISAQQLSRVAAVLAEQELNIDRIERLSGRLSLAVHSPLANACVELRVSGLPRSQDEMRAAFLGLAQEFPIDIAFQRESIFRRNRRLFAFDMDSTLIQLRWRALPIRW